MNWHYRKTVGAFPSWLAHLGREKNLVATPLTLSPYLMRWICSFLCQIGNWEQNATPSKLLLRGVCWRPEPLLRVQLHSILIHPETHADMCEIKIGPHVGFNKEQPHKSSTDASDLSLGLWAFHGNVNFPLTLIGHPLAVNNSPIESGQCPLPASGAEGPGL